MLMKVYFRDQEVQPGRPLAAGGAMGWRCGGHPDAEDAMGLRRAGDAMKRRREGCPNFGF
jgi:hypothetical protein